MLETGKVKDGDKVRCNTNRFQISTSNSLCAGMVVTVKRADNSDNTLWLEEVVGWYPYSAFDPIESAEVDVDRIWNAVVEIAGRSH